MVASLSPGKWKHMEGQAVIAPDGMSIMRVEPAISTFKFVTLVLYIFRTFMWI